MPICLYSRPWKIQAALWRPGRQHKPRLYYRTSEAHRSLQPWGSVARQGFLRDGRVHGRRRRPRYSSAPGCDPNVRLGEARQVLSGIDLRAVWQGRRNPAERDDAFLPPITVWLRQTLRILDRGQLPRSLWHVCLQRDLIQPREPQARQNFRDEEDFACSS